jgi:DNA-binding transcriptional regulator GbsR (MarR family)
MPIDKTASRHEPTVPGVSNSRRPRVIRPVLSRVEQICVAILDFITTHGCRVTLSQLRRRLNASRYPGTFDAAVRQLQDLHAITIEKEPGTRRQWVTLVEIPKQLEATRPQPKRRRHRPRSRGQSPWFQSLMTRRTAEQFASLISELRDAIREGQSEKSRQAARRIVDRLREQGA